MSVPETILCAEYVWIGVKGELRSKTKVINSPTSLQGYDARALTAWPPPAEIGLRWSPTDLLYAAATPESFPIWNFDGSSTNQATGEDSEVILKPCAVFDDPFRGNPHKLILCDTYYPDEIRPLDSNKRVWADNIFNKKIDEEPWFGLEQEYFIFDLPQDVHQHRPLGFPTSNAIHSKLATGEQGQYYCSSGSQNAFGREIAEEHLQACIKAGIKISGINAEVAPGQWEFQIGPCTGIEAGDHLWMARYLLNRVAERHNKLINYHPKPIPLSEPLAAHLGCTPYNWNGSGCHANYSTKKMRTKDVKCPKAGLGYINEAILKLSKKHKEHMEVYGTGNKKRMTGGCETASYDTFSDGVADRSASIRRGNKTVSDGYGYFEDRRPSSNCDPYLVTAKIFETTVLFAKL
jgi:glutamine synthetase